MTMGLLIGGALILMFSIVGIGLLFYAGKNTITEQRATPELGTSGDVIVVSGEDFNAESVKSASIQDREATVLEASGNEVRVRIPSFPNLAAGSQQTEIVLQGSKGTIAKAPFNLIILP